MRIRLLALALILAAALAGCAAQAASIKPVETTTVVMPPSYRFDPPVIQVKAGSTVTWTNKDNFTHDVHLLSGINWISSPLHPGESASYTFTKPGDYDYQCDFHSQNMKGRVIVVPASP